jgi:hypothetical protein
MIQSFHPPDLSGKNENHSVRRSGDSAERRQLSGIK